MNFRPTTEFVLAVVLATSFVSVGLLTLWAATSRTHWFVRTLVVLAMLSVLLLIPAYEPLLVLAIEVLCILVGVASWPFLRRLSPNFNIKLQMRPADPAHPRNWRFMLRMLLYATPVVVLIDLVVAMLCPYWLLPRSVGNVVLLLFAVEAGVLLTGVLIWSLARRCQIQFARSQPASQVQPQRPREFRFSLQSLLLFTPIVAIVAAISSRISMHMPNQIAEGWTSIVVDGLVAGLSVLVGVWIVVTRLKWLAWPLAILILLGLGILAPALEWFVWASGSWPPQVSAWRLSSSVFQVPYLLPPRRDVATWMGITASVGIVVFLCVSLSATAIGHVSATPLTTERRCERSTLSRIAAGVSLAVILLAVVSVPSYVTWKLLHPARLPHIASPEPNGIDEIIPAVNSFNTSQILSTIVEPSSTAALKAEVIKYSAAYDQLHRGLHQSVRVDRWPKPGESIQNYQSSLPELQAARSAARALMRESQLAHQEQRHREAAQHALESIHLGQDMTRDSRHLGYLIGMAVEGFGDATLFETIADLDADTCQEAIADLVRIDAHREPFEEVNRRDRAWSENEFGWSGHFYYIVQDWLETEAEQLARFWDVRKRKQAITRMLTIELAIRAFALKHGNIPNTLEELTPEFLTTIPLDPFDPAGGRLRYVKTEDSHFIYSVGVDRIDNGGQTTESSSGLINDNPDLRLDIFLAPEPTTTQTDSPTTNNAGDGDTTTETQPVESDGGGSDK